MPLVSLSYYSSIIALLLLDWKMAAWYMLIDANWRVAAYCSYTVAIVIVQSPPL